MLSTLKALAVEQQVGHLLAEHQHDSWSDPDCERERRRVARAAKEHQSLQEREKEETLIVVPRLPAPCPICLAESVLMLQTGITTALHTSKWRFSAPAATSSKVRRRAAESFLLVWIEWRCCVRLKTPGSRWLAGRLASSMSTGGLIVFSN